MYIGVHIMMISHLTVMCAVIHSVIILNTHARKHVGDVDTPVMCVVRHSLIGIV